VHHFEVQLFQATMLVKPELVSVTSVLVVEQRSKGWYTLLFFVALLISSLKFTGSVICLREGEALVDLLVVGI